MDNSVNSSKGININIYPTYKKISFCVILHNKVVNYLICAKHFIFNQMILLPFSIVSFQISSVINAIKTWRKVVGLIHYSVHQNKQ